MKKDNSKEKKVEKELTFLEKYKTDKKYKAKVELIGYGILILALIVYLNIASLSSTPGTVQNIIPTGNSDESVEEETSLEKSDLLKKMDDNYEYEVQVSFQKKEEENTDLDDGRLQIRYAGKRYDNHTVIEKEEETGVVNYYQIDSLYYVQEGEEYQSIKKDVVYDVIDSDFVEFDSLLKYLEQASLDHITNYSTGKKEYVYHLKVKDVVNHYSNSVDMVEFYVLDENEELSVRVDYSVLMKAMDMDISFCEVQYTYKNIGNVEKFEYFQVVYETENSQDEME